MTVIAAAIMVRRIVRHRRMFRWFLVRWLLVGRLRIFVVPVVVTVPVICIAGFILPLALHRAGAAEWSSAAVYLILALVPHLLQLKFLLSFHVTADVSVSTVALPALCQLCVLALVQRVYLVIKIFFQITARIGNFWFACIQN
jgi:hypothetical protein